MKLEHCQVIDSEFNGKAHVRAMAKAFTAELNSIMHDLAAENERVSAEERQKRRACTAHLYDSEAGHRADFPELFDTNGPH